MVCEEAEKNPAWIWILSVFLIIFSAVVSSLGVNLQKYSFLLEAKRPVKEKRTYVRQPKWISGMALLIVGNIGVFVALGFAPQIYITTVGGGFTLVMNIVFAHFFLKEAFSRRDAVATSMIILGVVIVAIFADKEAKCFTLEELVDLYSRLGFIIYAVVIVLTSISLVSLVKYIERLQKFFGPRSAQYAKFERIHPVLYPALSGLFGAQSTLFAKSTAELIKVTFAGDNQFTQYGPYLIVVALGICVFLQIHWLAQGLQRFDAVFTVPIFQCSAILFSIASGGVYFNEFQNMSLLQVLMFILGVSVTLVGVIRLSQRPMNVLKPLTRFRASVRAIMFIKRAQKDLGLHYHWVDERIQHKPPSIFPIRFSSRVANTNLPFAEQGPARPARCSRKTSSCNTEKTLSEHGDTLSVGEEALSVGEDGFTDTPDEKIVLMESQQGMYL